MSRDLTVRYLGRDSSGRGLYMTQWMLDVHNAIKRHPLVSPFAWKIVIVQGAFMVRNGGGAQDSSGVHNAAGCLDIRTWNLTYMEINAWVRASRLLAFPYWRRDQFWIHGGMPEHAHGVLGSDGPHSAGSWASWTSYLNDGDGLAGPGSDYEWRPDPLVIFPPAELMEGDWLMADQGDRVERKVDRLLQELETFRTNEAKRDREAAIKARESKERLVEVMGGLGDMLGLLIDKKTVTKADLKDVQERILQALADDPDVDGRDNPAPRDPQ